MKKLLKKVSEMCFPDVKRQKRRFLHFFFIFALGCRKLDARAMYIALNRKIERMYEILVIVVAKITIAAYTPFAVFLALVNYFVFDLGAESYYLPAPMLLPFDWQTPFGYPFALLLQALALYADILCVISFIVCTIVVPAWVTILFLKDFTNDLSTLIVGRRSLNKCEETKKRICNSVQFYLDLKELSVRKNSIHICQLYLFIIYQQDFLFLQCNLQIDGDYVFYVCCFCNMRDNASNSNAIS